MNIDINALELAALSATPGDWSMRDDRYSGELHYMVVDKNSAPLFDSVNRSPAAQSATEKADMQFAAMANPKTIIELIRQLRGAEKQCDTLVIALHVAMPFVEDHEASDAYKPGAVSKALKTIRAAITSAEGGAACN